MIVDRQTNKQTNYISLSDYFNCILYPLRRQTQTCNKCLDLTNLASDSDTIGDDCWAASLLGSLATDPGSFIRLLVTIATTHSAASSFCQYTKYYHSCKMIAAIALPRWGRFTRRTGLHYAGCNSKWGRQSLMKGRICNMGAIGLHFLLSRAIIVLNNPLI